MKGKTFAMQRFSPKIKMYKNSWLNLACNRICHVQLQRPATSRCFGGTSICAVPNFTLLPRKSIRFFFVCSYFEEAYSTHYDKSTSAFGKGRPTNYGLCGQHRHTPMKGHVSFISLRVKRRIG